MNKRLKFLHIAALIFKIIAWISVAFFVVVSIIVLLGAGGDTPRIASIVFIIGGGLYFLVLFTIAEAINLLVFLAEKTSMQGAASLESDVSSTVQSLSSKIDRLTAILEGKPTEK